MKKTYENIEITLILLADDIVTANGSRKTTTLITCRNSLKTLVNSPNRARA